MTDPYTEQLEQIIGQMLIPLRGLPFHLIIKHLSGHEVLAVNPTTDRDRQLLAGLEEVIRQCAQRIIANPIRRARPNEVGNDAEPFVKNALAAVGFRVELPRGKSGATKAAGYPDILFYDSFDRPTYLECKTNSAETVDSGLRSFFLSPSKDFKITMDARHLVLSFEMKRVPISNSRDSFYTPVAFSLVDLKNLTCDVKHEFNSDNQRLYDAKLVLLHGSLP